MEEITPKVTEEKIEQKQENEEFEEITFDNF